MVHFCADSGTDTCDATGVTEREEEDVKGRMRRLRKLGMAAIIVKKTRRRKSLRETGWEGRL